MIDTGPLPLRLTPQLAARIAGRALFIAAVTIAELAAIGSFIGMVGFVAHLINGRS